METGWFVRVENPKGDRVRVYGPFPSERDARVKNIFYRSDAELAAACRKPGDLEVYSQVGVSHFTADELRTVAGDPGAYRLKSFKVLPASALKNHPDWAGRDLEFFARYYVDGE